MDNVVQNISVEDIVPRKFQPSNEELRKISELSQLIKVFGILDPILVRPKNGKYEIVLGVDKYQAALNAGLHSIPAIVKEIDDETFSKYANIEKHENMNLNSSIIDSPSNDFRVPLEERINKIDESSFIRNINNNEDVVNLSVLNQKEYERNERKMNNEQLNNMNNNYNQPQPTMNNQSAAPAFGGKFFPSLEDEPTNMNMGNLNNMPNFNNIPQGPTSTLETTPSIPNKVETNNLIDLTDLSMDKQPQTPSIPDMSSIPQPNVDLNLNQSQDFQTPQPTFGISQSFEQSPVTPVNNGSPDLLVNINSQVSSSSMEANNFQTIDPMKPAPPQFDIPKNIDIVPELNQAQSILQNDFRKEESVVESPEITRLNQQLYSETPVNKSDFGIPTTAPTPEPSVAKIKDITPVSNTIKSLVSSLEGFGYKINILEEDLPTSAKITIEIEK